MITNPKKLSWSFSRKRSHSDDDNVALENEILPLKLQKQDDGSEDSHMNPFQKRFLEFFGWFKKPTNPFAKTFCETAMSGFRRQNFSADSLDEIVANPTRSHRAIQKPINLKPSNNLCELSPIQKRSRENFSFLQSDKQKNESKEKGLSTFWKNRSSNLSSVPFNVKYSVTQKPDASRISEPRYKYVKPSVPLCDINVNSEQRDGELYRRGMSAFDPKPYSTSSFSSCEKKPAALQDSRNRSAACSKDSGRNSIMNGSSLVKIHRPPCAAKADSTTQQNGVRWKTTKVDVSKKRQSFTANEVIKMNDREQYSLLIDSFTKGCNYKPAVPYIPDKVKCEEKAEESTVTKEVVDLTQDDLFDVYMKPCAIVSQTALKKYKLEEKKVVEVNLDSDSDDNEVLFVEKPKTSRNFPTPEMQKTQLLSPAWVNELRMALESEKEERTRVETAHYQKLKEYKTKRDAERAEKYRLLKLLLTKGKKKEIVLPELTPEMEMLVDNAICNAGEDTVIARLTTATVTRKDLETLFHLNWLNDEIINFYFELLVIRGKRKDFPNVYSFNTFFYPNLKSKGYSALRRWTRKVDLFSFDMVLIPVHLGMHWCLCVIDFRHKTMKYYDSMLGNSEASIFNYLKEYLVSESMDKKKQTFDLSSWTTELVKDIPPQLNGSDCGMFSLKYAEYLSRDKEITFTQENMPYFRRCALYEIITSELL